MIIIRSLIFSFDRKNKKLAFFNERVQNKRMEDKQTIMSMTGYGRSEVQIDGKYLVTEIRSVNHRFLEVKVKLPPRWLALEDPIRKQVKQRLRRGRVDLFISTEGFADGERQLQFDWKLFHDYLQIKKKLEKDYGVLGELRIGDLFAQDDLWTYRESEQDLDRLAPHLLQSVQEACQQLEQMRRKEGKILADDLMKRCQKLKGILSKINARAPQVSEYYRKRLEERLAELFSVEKMDQDRLLLEVAIFADRTDITEECIRFSSHIGQFEDALRSTDSVGRHLDFLLQEMNREINTIGAKANDQMISTWVVQSKSELEKMKEQVQNIE